jgi:(R,R)-butanediol dehydrogenase / meso-butanediol dehydrogenase / diacetyl reductase
MLAAVLHGPRDVRLHQRPDPEPGAGEVVVRVTRVGICGSDVNRFLYGSHPWPPGFVMGHEFCGDVVAVGAGVADAHVGAEVVVEPTLRCGTCFYCRRAEYNRCADFIRRGLTGSGTDGAFAHFVRVPAYQLHARPPALTDALAALVEPTAVSVHGWNLAALDRPESVVVVGIGNIGLLAVLVARAKGAGEIIVVGKYAARQALARAYGATLVLEPDDPRLHEQIRERTDGVGAAAVLEAAGTPGSLRTAVACARKGGRIVLLGVMHEPVALDYKAILMEEKQIFGSIIYRRPDFAEAMAILAEATIDSRRHVTAEIPLDRIVAEGLEPLAKSKADHVKIQVCPRG